MKELLTFDTMITPKIIVVIYVLSLLSVLVTGVLTIIGGSIFTGLIIIPVGALFARVYCELFVVLFKINEALQEIRKK